MENLTQKSSLLLEKRSLVAAIGGYPMRWCRAPALDAVPKRLRFTPDGISSSLERFLMEAMLYERRK